MKTLTLAVLFLIGLTGSLPSLAGGGHMHRHGSMDATDKGNPPAVKLMVEEDAMSGWNLHIMTRNFRFTPEKVNQKDMAGEGHAHVYLDGKKVARVYGPWFHLPALEPGRHRVKVVLNTNSHREYVVNGITVHDTVEINQSASKEHVHH